MSVLRLFLKLATPLISFVERINPWKKVLGSIDLPEREHVPHPDTATEELEAALNHLNGQCIAWQHLPRGQRVKLLRRSLHLARANVKNFALENVRIKGSYGQGLGDELREMLPVFFYLTDLIRAVRADGKPRANKVQKVGDRCIVDVYPRGLDNLLLPMKAELWLQRGEPVAQGWHGLRSGQMTGIACVLGAGNYLCTVIRDTLHELFMENCLPVLKINPANSWMGSQVEAVLAPFISAGFIKVVYGSQRVAQGLLQDPRVVAAYMTGSTATYNSIVWGSAGPGAGPKLFEKPMLAELGGVTPFVVVPSAQTWSKQQLEAAAAAALGSVVINAGHSCNSTEIVVTAKSWAQRAEFMRVVRQMLTTQFQRRPWYPGSQAKYDAFKKRFPDSQALGHGACSFSGACTQAYLLAEDVAPDAAQVDRENWCCVLQEVGLDTPTGVDGKVDVADFMKAATRWCNDVCTGSLAIGLAVHPATEKSHHMELLSMVSELKYGSVNVNTSPAVGYTISRTPWGGWASAGTPEDIGSGNALCDTMCYKNVEKGVIWMPLVQVPKPIGHPQHTNLESTSLRLMDYLMNRNPLTLLLLLLAAVSSG